jgi:[ribosomal protein S5]-alanine N-acetyltransferase
MEAGPVIYAGEVYLRAPQMGDHSEWASLRDLSREFLTPWEPAWPSDDLARSSYRRRVRRYQRDIRDDRAYPFFVFRSSDNVLVGGVTLSNIRRGVAQACSLGYWIGKPYARQGYMASAVSSTASFVFGTLHMHRLEAACIPDNRASVNLLIKCGFNEEGYAREYLLINGDWQDHKLFALLAP